MENDKINVTFLNQSNDGLGKEIEIPVNMRIDDFLYSQLGEGADLSSLKIRMNSEIVTRTTAITPDARIVISQLNVKGG